MFYFWTLVSVSEHCWRWRIRPKHLKCSVWLFSDPCVMFQNTNVLFLNSFDAILNIMGANACVLSVEFIYSVDTIMQFHLTFRSFHLSLCIEMLLKDRLAISFSSLSLLRLNRWFPRSLEVPPMLTLQMSLPYLYGTVDWQSLCQEMCWCLATLDHQHEQFWQTTYTCVAPGFLWHFVDRLLIFPLAANSLETPQSSAKPLIYCLFLTYIFIQHPLALKSSGSGAL